MPQFSYRAKKGPKEVVEGVLEAESRYAAISRLTSMDLFPIKVEEKGHMDEKKGALPISLPSSTGGRIGSKELAVFERQLADLIDAGLPLLRALEVLQEQTEHRAMKGMLSGLIEDVRSGKPLSEGMSRFSKVFNSMTVSMVHAGEIGGILNTVLSRLADFAEKDQEMRSKIRSAMAYPIFLCLMGVLTIVVLMVFVIPKLMPVFEDIGQGLPLPTAILLGVSSFLRGYWWILVGVGVLGGVLFRRRLQTKEGRKSFDQMRMTLPLFGPLVKKSEIARFSRTLSALLGNGVPVLQSLRITSDGVGNVILRDELRKVFEEISRGQQLGDCMKKSPLFPPFVVNMIVVGEQGGTLERALDKVADAYEREVDRAVKMMTSLLEPAMILVMGSLVGFIVMAMLLPIFSINLAAQ